MILKKTLFWTVTFLTYTAVTIIGAAISFEPSLYYNPPILEYLRPLLPTLITQSVVFIVILTVINIKTLNNRAFESLENFKKAIPRILLSIFLAHIISEIIYVFVYLLLILIVGILTKGALNLG